jgi:hypothetical protein
MYTVATFRLAQAIDAPILMTIPRVFVYYSPWRRWTLTMTVAAREFLRGRASPRVSAAAILRTLPSSGR